MSVQMSDENVRAVRESVMLGSVVVGVGVGVGDSTGSRAALEWAVGHVAGDIHVVCAVSPILELFEASLQIDSSRVDRASAELAALVGDVTGGHDAICQHVVEDAVHESLLDVAHRYSVDAIVVGGQGRERTPHLIGANTGRLLHVSDVPIVVVPEDWTAISKTPETDSLEVMVGASGDPLADSLLVAWARSICGDGAHGGLVHAVSRSMLAHAAKGMGPEHIERAAFDELAGLVSDDWPWEVSVVLDDPLSVLVSASTRSSFLVVGSHRSSRVAGFLTGAIAQHLPSLVSCPIALVPIDLDPQEDR